MSAHTDIQYTTENADGFEKIKNTIIQINIEGMEEMLKVWFELYGPTNVFGDRITKLVNDIKVFWECQIESQNERKKSLTKSIEQAGKDALRLEKILGLKAEVQNLTCGTEIPLVTLEEQIWKILNSYQELSDKRLEEYSQLQKKEEELCTILSLKPQIKDELFATRKGGGSKRKDSYIPTSDNMNTYRERIYALEKEREQLEYDFETYKDKLRSLLEQCEGTPNKTVERYFSSDKEELPVTRKNLKLLISTTDYYLNIREEMVAEADHLRNEVKSLSKKMFLDMNDLESFFQENKGSTKTTIDNLKEKLKQLREERKKNLKHLIINHRTVLNELWEKCCYSEEEKSQFKPYQTNHCSEEVLNFYEIEIERLEHYYNENKRIFQLSKKYDDLWSRLLHLEELASNKDRLFNNRGGCLLKEEKERKLIQKKVPTIKAELMALLNKYREDTGKEFMHYGIPLRRKIEQKEEQREISKENEKLMRKVINEENLFVESRLGVRPSTAGNKRRLLTPQHPNNYPKLLKTAHSTPRISRSASTLTGSAISENAWTRVVKESGQKGDSWLNPKPRATKVVRRIKCDTPRPVVKPMASTPQCSFSYESFQEHISKSSSKRSHEKCLQPVDCRILRPRNENKPKFQSEKKLNRFNTPVVKMTLKSATVSKIPRPTTPIVPKPATKAAGTRRKLPIIF